MTSCVAFLRAINVGGRRVTNDQLAAAVTGAGFGDVKTYQAAGNLILDSGDLAPADVEAHIESALTQALGFTAEVFVRTPTQIAAILDRQPFDSDDVATATAKPQIGFIQNPPSSQTIDAVLALATPRDHLAVIERELHWLPMDGIGRAALNTAMLERLLNAYTVRSQTTVARIHAKYLTV